MMTTNVEPITVVTRTKWMDKETNDPYELFDKMIYEKIRSLLLSTLKLYVKTTPGVNGEEGISTAVTVIHIYEKGYKDISYYYEVSDTDRYINSSIGADTIANGAINGFRNFVLDRYFAKKEVTDYKFMLDRYFAKKEVTE